MPKVHDALTAHLWWEKGQLREWLAGRGAMPHLNELIEIAAGAVAELEIHHQAERVQRNKP